MGALIMFKRGYENGEKVLEIHDGYIDLVCYHERTPSFYFYRINPTLFFQEPPARDDNRYSKESVAEWFKSKGLTYEEAFNKFLKFALGNLEPRYEM
jgi:hypothetical protein